MLAVVMATPGLSSAQIGFSGASWGELRHEGGEGEVNTLLYGWIDQGVDWMEIGKFKLNTYGILRYSFDTEGLNWNNSLAPGVGIAVRRGALKIGAEAFQEHSTQSNRTENKAVLYMNWWVGWDLKR
jgi:hypothetical protein